MTNPLKTETEILRRVHYDRQYLTVRECPDNPSYVQLHVDSSQEEYWGKIDLAMPPELARHLGQALIDQADDVERKG